jgi:hypothetical protein
MTRHEQHTPGDDDSADAKPLDPWMLDLVREVEAEADTHVDVPREMMWARIQRERAKAAPVVVTRRPWYASRQIAAAAAVLVAGVAIGRYVVPSGTPGAGLARDTAVVAPAVAPTASMSADPSYVAMQEHLVRTVALLTTVRDESVQRDAAADLAPRAKELLSTTRLLLDQPQLRDERTRRLLQDLELVLVQVIQARSTAPETQRAPQETLRETNLLTRVNALVTASTLTGAAIYGGD